MGVTRSVNAVSLKLCKSRTIITRWSSKHDWVSRTRAWDERISDLKEKVTIKTAIAATVRETGSRVERILKERDEWLTGKKARAVKIIRQGEYLLSFPARDEVRETPEGPLIIKAANANIIRSGARMMVIGEAMYSETQREEMVAACYERVDDTPLPDVDSERSVEVKRLDVLASAFAAAAARGDFEAAALVLRVSERKARLLGLDAQPAPAAPSGDLSPAPMFIEVHRAKVADPP